MVRGYRGEYWDSPFEVFERMRELGSYEYEYDLGGGGGGGGGYAPSVPLSIEEVHRRLKNNSIFMRLAQKLKNYILSSESLARVILDAVNRSKFEFGGAQTTAAFDGATFYLPSSILTDDEIREVDVSFFIHEMGHFYYGIPYAESFYAPNEYAVARAQAEVYANIFMALIAKELGRVDFFISLSGGDISQIQQEGSLAPERFKNNYEINLIKRPSLGQPEGRDVDGDGVVTNKDIYLDKYRGPEGLTYNEWKNGRRVFPPGQGGAGSGIPKEKEPPQEQR